MSAERPPAFQFYPRDFESDGRVEAMDNEQVGAYIRLLCKAWFEDPPGSIPNDPAILARWARCTPQRWKKISPLILSCFELRHDSRYHQKRMQLVDAGQQEWRAKSSDGGKRSARLREARKKGTHTGIQWAKLVAAMEGVCPRCKQPCAEFHKDHVVPIYKGGSDGIDNIQPLCPRCNAAKGPEVIDFISAIRATVVGTTLEPPLEPNGNTASASASASARTDYSASNDAGADAPTSFPHSPAATAGEQPWNRTLMPVLRECGFAADGRDGSVVKSLIEAGTRIDEVENVVRGLALLRERGHLERVLGVGPGEQLNMRMLVAPIAKDKIGILPLYREAENAYFESTKRGSAHGMSKVQIGFQVKG